mgnify:CR=1 FL=1
MTTKNLAIGTKVAASVQNNVSTFGVIVKAIDLLQGNWLYVISSNWLNGCGKPCTFGIFDTEILKVY